MIPTDIFDTHWTLRRGDTTQLLLSFIIHTVTACSSAISEHHNNEMRYTMMINKLLWYRYFFFNLARSQQHLGYTPHIVWEIGQINCTQMSTYAEYSACTWLTRQNGRRNDAKNEWKLRDNKQTTKLFFCLNFLQRRHTPLLDSGVRVLENLTAWIQHKTWKKVTTIVWTKKWSKLIEAIKWAKRCTCQIWTKLA